MDTNPSKSRIADFLIKDYIKIKDPKEREQFVKTYQFINFICSNFKMTLSKDFILSFIENGKFIPLENINKKIFAIAEEKAKKVENIPKNENIDISIILNNNAELNKNQISSLEAEKKYISSDLKTFHQRTLDCYNTLRDLDFKIENLKQNKGYEIIELINSAINIKDIVKVGYRKECNSVFFETSNIILEDNDKEYNLGKFLIFINVSTAIATVLPHGENKFYNSFIHHHVFVDGYVCYGNAGAAVTEHIKKKNYKQILITIMQILKSRNPSSETIGFSGLMNSTHSIGEYKNTIRGYNPIQKDFFHNKEYHPSYDEEYLMTNGYMKIFFNREESEKNSNIMNLSSKDVDLALEVLSSDKTKEEKKTKTVKSMKTFAIQSLEGIVNE